MMAKIIAILLSGGHTKVTNPTEMCEHRQSPTDGDWKGRWSKLHQSSHKERLDWKRQLRVSKWKKKRKRQDVIFEEYPLLKYLGCRCL